MKVLSIGNSFSQDAHKWLHTLAKHNGIDMDTANLFIGGCSLETHYINIEENNAFYDLELNGGECERKISIEEALKMEQWDIITLQQVSQLSGVPESYEPYLLKIVAYVKSICPKAELYFHQTWAYEMDSTHGGFAEYHCDQQEMYQRVKETTELYAQKIGAKLIPVGVAIQNIRENIAEFDYANGGLSLCRDGFHLSLDYGRFAAAAVWFRALTGQEIQVSSFEGFDEIKLEKIIALINVMENVIL